MENPNPNYFKDKSKTETNDFIFAKKTKKYLKTYSQNNDLV
ncbi:hypothetical protein CSG_18140 [Campylobacter fetus subsp. venerealis str. 84-112]|uniref:Uncharacterized protein n=1 Tax=Campylobacter fetus subsp. fetus (strain 82-40) TaxID=360106 RepID=A0RRH2_CAMFF|nr:hypothetical protein CFF8240_1680 [Campylobacter fetus subsp. fetus 82-40]CDF65725.1 hypothetical protein CSG_18140 [Campylobacter fetus subsp. venerealis str. 84-112]